jgi:monofunctional biosynthetic peptidoglycan transglycosylase
MRVRPLRWLGRLLAYVLLALAAIFLFVQGWFFLHIVYWKYGSPGSTSFMEARLSQLRSKNPKAELKYVWTDYARISNHLKRAIIAAEDMKFVDHEGFDWEGIQRAIEKNQKKGKAVAGGSTITQQLAKNLFLSGERSYLRKGQEAIITLMLEAVLDKRRILELYLNVAEWGIGVFGAEAAARHYYGGSAAGLGPDQAARLAAMLPRPQFYDRNRGSAYLGAYAERIAGRMGGAQLP